jgi:hypothetical protein
MENIKIKTCWPRPCARPVRRGNTRLVTLMSVKNAIPANFKKRSKEPNTCANFVRLEKNSKPKHWLAVFVKVGSIKNKTTRNQPVAKCFPGEYAFQAGLAQCSLCPVGWAQNKSGAVSCEGCTIGLYTGCEGRKQETFAEILSIVGLLTFFFCFYS